MDARIFRLNLLLIAISENQRIKGEILFLDLGEDVRPRVAGNMSNLKITFSPAELFPNGSAAKHCEYSSVWRIRLEEKRI